MTPKEQEVKPAPFWWEEAPYPPEARTAEGRVRSGKPVSQTAYDVLIIGAGLTGLSAARSFARAGKSVLAVEAATPGMGASSRNGGMVGGGHKLSYDALVRQSGAEVAKSLISEAHNASTAFVTDLIKSEGIECGFTVCGRFRGFSYPGDYENQRRTTGFLQDLIGLDATFVAPKDTMRELCSNAYFGGVVLNRHGGLNPAAYVAGLMTAAEKHGARLLCGTEVLGVKQDGASLKVRTSAGIFTAGQVLMATNGYTPDWAEQGRHIIPVPSFMIATEVLGKDVVRRLFPTGRMCVETGSRHSYFRPSPCGTRIVLGARAALVNISQATATAKLAANLARIFPELKNVKISHSWRGGLGFAFDHMPNIGKINGIWHAMGFSGNGNTLAPYLGHKAALTMLGDPGGETAFTRTAFPKTFYHRGLRYAPSPATANRRPAPKSPWFMPIADTWWRLKDLR